MKKFDKFQRDIINYEVKEDSCLTVQAGAGSGKSTTMVGKCMRLIEDGLNPSSILMTTFSNKSVRDLKHKFKAMYPNQIKLPQITTLHSFGIYLLKEVIGLDFKVINESQATKLMLEVLEEEGFFEDVEDKQKYPFAKTVQEYIAVYKEQNLGYLEILSDKDFDIFQYSNEVTKVFNRFQFLRIAKAYHNKKQSEEVLDFGDLVYEAFHILRENEEILEDVRKMFKFAIIDEAQDINQVQWDLIMLIFQGKKLVAVGDRVQNIYNFRYSMPENFTPDYLGKFFSNVKELELKYNYRSKKEIVEFGNIVRVIAGNTLQLLPYQESKPDSVRFEAVYDNVQEGNKVAEIIKDLVENQGYDYKDISIVIRGNAVIKTIVEPSLIKEKIPYLIKNNTTGAKMTDRLSTELFFNALSVVYDINDKFAFVDFLRELDYPLEEIEKVSDFLQNNPLEDVTSLDDEFITDLYNNFVSMHDLLDGYDKVEIILSDIYHIIKNNVNSVYGGDLSLVYKSIVNLWYNIKAENTESSIKETLQEMIVRVRDFDEAKEANKVQLGTIHSFKGLESKVSIVCGFTSFRPKKDPLNDEANMLYVQVSRAMEKLFIVNSYNFVSKNFKTSEGYINEYLSSAVLKYKRLRGLIRG